MKRLLLTIVAIAALAAAVNTPIGVLPGAYFIELNDKADLAAFAERVKTQAHARIRRQIDYTPYKTKANRSYKAVSIELRNTSKINEVASMADVAKIYPVEVLTLDGFSPSSEGPKAGKQQPIVSKKGESLAVRRGLPKTNMTANPFPPHSMMQVDKLHSKGITGKGIKIAMISSGVDYEHPALGGCFGPGCLVSFGADLVNDELTPKDCLGHGTMAAGVIAAQTNPMGFTGAAPGVQLGMFRVTCNGSFDSDVMAEAIYRALEEGADIISSSVPLLGAWPDSLLSSIASQVVDSGVVFVQGAGDDGMNGLFSHRGPAVGSGVISVGSMNSPVYPLFPVAAKYTVDNGSEFTFPFYPTGPQGMFTGTPIEVYAPSLLAAGNDIHACGPIQENTPDLRDKLVLLRVSLGVGDCNIKARIQSAHERGATRILVYMATEDGSPTFVFLPFVPKDIVAVGMLGFDIATSMLEALQAGGKVLVTAFSLYDDPPVLYTEEPNRLNAGAVSSFSSWGPSWNLGLKPSLSAVGAGIISTAAGNKYPSGYSMRHGTFLSGALMAGIIALILEARGPLDPATIESLLVSHSLPQLYHDRHKFQPYLAPVAQQGGGLVRAYDSAYSTTLLEPASLNFNDTEHRVASLNLTLKNVGKADVTYRLSHVPAITIYAFTKNGTISSYPRNLDKVDIPAAITLSDTNLTVASGSSAIVSVSALVPDSLDTKRLPLWSGWIAINGSDGSSLSVPYQGTAGSIRNHQVLPLDGASLFYRNVSVSENAVVRLPTPGSIEVSELVLNISPTLGTPLVRAEVIPLTSVDNTGDANYISAKSIGQLQGFPLLWCPLNFPKAEPALVQFAPFRWNGQLDSGSFAPEGSYKLVVRALRIFGDPNNDEDWDLSESQRFNITYH